MAATSSVNIEIAKIDAAKSITCAMVTNKTFPVEGPQRDATYDAVCMLYKKIWNAVNDPKLEE